MNSRSNGSGPKLSKGMKIYRLNRLFNPKSNRCFDVAVDHGFFNERGFLQGIENILSIKPQCDRHSMPLMIEPLVFQANQKAGGYMVDGDLEKILPLVRQAVELGADIIKADPTDDVGVYSKVVEIAGRIPVLVRGGGKAPDQEILTRTEKLIQQGAAGIVYGRNIIQHANPAGMTRALMAIVHDGATATQAAKFIKG